jgi:hypothetical protein
MDTDGCGPFILGILLGAAFMIFGPMRCSADLFHQEAVDHKAGHWEVKNGDATFKWNETKPEPRND